MPDDPSTFAPPPAFGPFRVLHQIGVGALGPVFRTYEPTRDRLVAVKVFRLDITPEGAQGLADELSTAAEAGLFHPSIVEPIAAGVAGTVAYRAEEYVAAETLDVAMRHIAPSPLAKVLPIITQLAGAIDFARAAGVGHGALHPRDIFVTPDETRATGFGVVDALERVGIRAPVRRPYSAPERIEGSQWGTPADVFALGAITYELLSGKRPSGTGTEIGPLPGSLGAAQDSVLAVLTTAMHPDPSRRYATALAFAGALEGAVHGKPAAETPAAVPVAATTTGDEEEQSERDIAAERDDDVAHHDLIMREQVEETPLLASVDDDEPEAEADRMMLAAAAVASDEPSARLKDGFTPLESARPAPPARTAVTREHEYPYQAAIVPDRRSRALPMAGMLSLGLLVGFAVGYGVGTRNSRPDDARSGAQTQTQPGAPSAGAPFSEQTVARPPSTLSEPPAPAAAAASPPPAPAEAPDARPATPRVAAAGRLVVDSIPARAGVMVDGRWRGRTPLNLDQLPFGKHTLRVVQPGYVPSDRNFTLSANDPIEVLSVRLQRQEAARAPEPAPRAPRGANPGTGRSPATSASSRSFTGSIYVDSRPRGARVSLDGRPVGTTPVSVPEVRIGAHVIRLELPEHRPWSTSTRVAAGEVVRVTGSLERIQ